MEIIRKSDTHAENMTDAPLFHGGKVTRQSIVDTPKTDQFSLALISFYDGAKNHFHTHTSDQVLFATEGVGVVANESHNLEMKAGDTAFIPAGEKHWHGASDGHDFIHISLTQPGSITELFLPESTE